MDRLRSFVERLAGRRGFIPGLAVAGVASLAILIAVGGGAMNRFSGNQEIKNDPVQSTDLPLTPGIDPRLIDPNNGSKFSYLYLKLFSAYKTGGTASAEAEARNLGILDDAGVHAVLVLKSPYTDELGTRLTNAGITVDKWADNRVVVTFPAKKLAEVSASKDFSFIQGVLSFDEIVDIQAPEKLSNEYAGPGLPESPTGSGRNVGLGPSEGVQRTGADKWQAAGIRGAGVKVGIIDIGFAGYKELLGKYLPANVTARDFSGNGIPAANAMKSVTEAHGTACAQIVYEMAPEAQLFLAQISDDTDIINAFNWLMEQKVDVISYSIGGFVSPPDGNSLAAKKIDQVRATGIFVSTSAGNNGDKNFVGTTTGTPGLVDFATDINLLPAFGVGGFAYLHWSEPSANFAILVLDETGKTVLADNRRQKASEPLGIGAPFPKDGKVAKVAIQQLSGPPTPFRILFRSRIQHPIFAAAFMSLGEDTTARGAVSVAAADTETDKIVTYSSWGPTMDGRFKPEIAAPTNVSSYYFKSIGGFNGTSAAAPHVSGAAALVKGRFPTYKADDIQKFLMTNAREIAVSGNTVGTFANGVGRLQLPDPSTLR